MATKAAMTNGELGELIGLTHSTVSRIRSGRRWPSIEVMLQIERVFDWPVAQQIALRPRTDRDIGKYAKALEEYVRAYATEAVQVPG